MNTSVNRAPLVAALGVDGGGTRCRMALVLAGQRHEVTLGSANMTADPDRSIATLLDGLQALAQTAALSVEQLSNIPGVFGLAGVLGREEADAVQAALPIRRLIVEDDRRIAVQGALGDRDGAVAALGTGSFFARKQGQSIRIVGGWGARLGDEASGYWIVRKALTATLDAHDGVRPATDLTRSLMARFQNRPREIVHLAQKGLPGEIAKLAPLVVAAADAGDPVGRGILENGCERILTVLGALGWQPGRPLCLIGGLADAYRDRLPASVAEGAIGPDGSALDGALALAKSLHGGAPR